MHKQKTNSIFLCASMAFYKELVEIEEKLKSRGIAVQIPVSAQVMKKNNDFEVSHFKDSFTAEKKREFILTNFKEIEKCDSIMVINNEKHGISGYIGANVLMEIGVAFFLGKTIYIWNHIQADASHAEELTAFAVQYIDRDLDKII